MNAESLYIYVMPLAILFSFSIAGLVLYLFPPKKINGIYGYRTPRSIKNQSNWDYAQKLGGKFMLIFGFVIFLIQITVGYFVSGYTRDQSIVLPIQGTILVILPIIMLLVCEKQIENFEKTNIQKF
jgi:uncharacterized membrane protein